MGTVHTFEPQTRGVIRADVRAALEAALKAALDTADRLISLLDRLDGNPEDEDGSDAEPSLGAPEGHASQIVWLRGLRERRGTVRRRRRLRRQGCRPSGRGC